MNKKEAPIGVFDSGVGGLTVVREIIYQMPQERLVYFGDTARVPYGSKSKETIIKYSRQIVNFLHSKNVKAIVVACNTASAYALDTIQAEWDIPIIGVVHAGARMSCKVTKNGKIGVIGTRGTVDSNIYPNYIHAIAKEVTVIQRACPLLVPLVEEGLLHDTVTDEIVTRYMTKLKGRFIDTLVLGCTHYPLLYPTISKIMGENVRLVNPALETAKELKELLQKKGIQFEGKREISTEEKYCFYVSDMAERFQEFAKSILPNEVKQTKKIDIEAYRNGEI